MSDHTVPPAMAKIAPDGNLTPRQMRRFLIEMSLRKQKSGTGSSPEFLQRRTATNQWPDLRHTLAGIPWIIIGGVATRAYMPERMTKDLDILVHQSDGEEVMQRLKKANFSAMRPQDWADISRMLGLASDEDLNRVRSIVARYSPEDSEDLESLIFLGQKELKPPSEEE